MLLISVHLKQFTDGLTNKLYKVVGHVDTTPRNPNGASEPTFKQKTALVRIYGKKTEILIDRERETRNLVCLARAGLVPPLYGRFKNGICYGYVEGIPFSVPGNTSHFNSALIINSFRYEASRKISSRGGHNGSVSYRRYSRR